MFTTLFTTYGCNKLIFDYTPDYLIAVDRFLVYELLDHGVDKQTKFYTQTDSTLSRYKDKDINYVIQDRRLADSGTAAMRLAGKHKHKYIYMIGFDYKHDYVDNVYAGTKHYIPTAQTIGVGYMLQQWEQRVRLNCKEFTNSTFYHVIGTDYIPNINKDNYIPITDQQFKEKLHELQNG